MFHGNMEPNSVNYSYEYLSFIHNAFITIMHIRQALGLKVISLGSWILDRGKPMKVKQDKRWIMNALNSV